MLNFLKYDLSHKKIFLKKSIFFIIFLCCATSIYFFAHIYLKQKLYSFLKNQQKQLQKQQLTLNFKSNLSTSWTLWPQIIITYPTLLTHTPNKQATLIWQAKEAKIYYSLWHPLSIMAELNGKQILCPQKEFNHCLQLDGDLWKIQLPFINNETEHSIHLHSDKVFFTYHHPLESSHISVQLANIYVELSGLMLGNEVNSASIKTNIQNITFNSTEFSLQKLNNIQIKAALIHDKKLSNSYYKLLVQQADFTWHNLSIHSAGKFYTFFPELSWTGQLSLNVHGINQLFYQQLSQRTCCNQLKEELSQTNLPSQINLTLLIRDNGIYLGAIPLHQALYNTIKTFIYTYAK